jgi:hypothetical protein
MMEVMIDTGSTHLWVNLRYSLVKCYSFFRLQIRVVQLFHVQIEFSKVLCHLPTNSLK